MKSRQTYSNVIKAIKSLDIQNIATHQKDITTHTAFFALQGTNVDGHDYIAKAIENGAALIVASKAYKNSTTCPVVIVDDTRISLAEALAYLYPKHPKHMVAVTGTNGKTSVVNYFFQICELLGKKVATQGSLGLMTHSTQKPIERTSLNTPDITTMCKMISELHDQGCEYFAFEASSHGIDQKRIYAIALKAAALTNITHDHLDYHGSFEAYRDAKLKLFSDNLDPDGTAIISTDCADLTYIKTYLETHRRKYITVGEDADLNITSCTALVSGQDIKFTYNHQDYSFHTPILGSFQANNILVASLLAEACGLNLTTVINVLPQLTAANGRLQRVTKENHPFQVFVDYAHTPDALEKSLNELSKLCTGKLFVVFGCGGDRDKKKRPLMGTVANKIADVVIITDDNPRTEDPGAIRAQIAVSAPNAVIIDDRMSAIIHSIGLLKQGDILLIAGKGHEDYQIIGTTKIPFSDAQVAIEAIKCRPSSIISATPLPTVISAKAEIQKNIPLDSRLRGNNSKDAQE